MVSAKLVFGVVSRVQGDAAMTADYFRVLATRCRTSARSCSDPYAKEEFECLAVQFDARASELDAPADTRWSIGSSPWQHEPARGFAGDH
jgi:hypothetical protein